MDDNGVTSRTSRKRCSCTVTCEPWVFPLDLAGGVQGHGVSSVVFLAAEMEPVLKKAACTWTAVRVTQDKWWHQPFIADVIYCLLVS